MRKRLKLFFNREILSYLVVGVLTTLVSWGTYAVFRLILNMKDPVQVQVAVVGRWVAGVVFAYFTNRVFVFKSRDSNFLLESIKFAGSRVVTLFVDMLIMCVMVSVINFNDWMATLTSAIVVTTLNYVFSKMLVFKNREFRSI